MFKFDHFREKSAINHVVEAQASGLIASTEIHAIEMPGSIFAATDAAKETSILFLLLSFLIPLTSADLLPLLLVLLFGWLIWKTGRSAALGWSRLEKLHRVLDEERWEIEHNREQEREELRALYAAKGFEGVLLKEVLDVLMADNDRLLKVMIEEELGLSLENQEHPLKQALGAFLGVLFVASASLLSLFLGGIWAGGIISLIIFSAASLLEAKLLGNLFIPAIIWNISLAILSISSTYFLYKFFSQGGG